MWREGLELLDSRNHSTQQQPPVKQPHSWSKAIQLVTRLHEEPSASKGASTPYRHAHSLYLTGYRCEWHSRLSPSRKLARPWLGRTAFLSATCFPCRFGRAAGTKTPKQHVARYFSWWWISLCWWATSWSIHIPVTPSDGPQVRHKSCRQNYQSLEDPPCFPFQLTCVCWQATKRRKSDGHSGPRPQHTGRINNSNLEMAIGKGWEEIFPPAQHPRRQGQKLRAPPMHAAFSASSALLHVEAIFKRQKRSLPRASS